MLHDEVQNIQDIGVHGDGTHADFSHIDTGFIEDQRAFRRRAARMLSRFFGTGTIGGAIKRSFDIVFASLALVTLSVPMVAIALALKLLDRGPVWFVHHRVGVNGRLFPCLKFRTMVTDAELRLQRHLASDPDAAAEFARTRKLRNDPRIIPGVGSFLRKTSLDELPQFFNVLLGHMSVVGPRPVTTEEFQLHYGYDHPYIETRPGVTGLWQVSGRNDVTYFERVCLDEDYSRNWSMRRDLEIIGKTLTVVCLDRNGH